MSDLASEIKAIRDRHGKLTPKLVLDTARDASHPLHSRFEWRDGLAAEKYRLIQAQELIASVRLTFVDSKGENRSARRYYAIRAADADEFDYDDVEEVMADRFRRKLLLNEMQRRIDELVQQYGVLEEFWTTLQGVARKRKRATG
jgi:hypothetical protein